MNVFITVLIVLVCLLLILVVLIQNPKGGGLASGFSSANQFGGVKRTTDFLEKSTWTLVILLMGLSIISASLTQSTTAPEAVQEDGVEQQLRTEPISTPQPAQPAPAQELPVFEDTEDEAGQE